MKRKRPWGHPHQCRAAVLHLWMHAETASQAHLIRSIIWWIRDVLTPTPA